MQIYAIVIIVVLLAFIIFRAVTTHFVCPQCGAEFKTSILAYIFAPHSFGKRLAKCPKCGHSEMLNPTWNKKQ